MPEPKYFWFKPSDELVEHFSYVVKLLGYEYLKMLDLEFDELFYGEQLRDFSREKIRDMVRSFTLKSSREKGLQGKLLIADREGFKEESNFILEHLLEGSGIKQASDNYKLTDRIKEEIYYWIENHDGERDDAGFSFIFKDGRAYITNIDEEIITLDKIPLSEWI